MTVQDAARQCGLPRQTLRSWEKGHAPSAASVAQICDNFGVEADWLLGDGAASPVRFRGRAVAAALGRRLDGQLAHYLHETCGVPTNRPIDGAAVLEFLRVAVAARTSWEDQVAGAIGDVLNIAGPYVHDSPEDASAARERRHAAMRAAWESRLPPQVAVPDMESAP